MKIWKYKEVIKLDQHYENMKRYMFLNVDIGADEEVYNKARRIALHVYGSVAAARWDMSGLIKLLNIDNSFGRYKHLSETKKRRKS